MVNGYSRSSHARKDKRKTKDHIYNHVDRVRLGQSSLQSSNYYHPPRGSGWRQKSISNLDLSTNRQSTAQYIEDERQLRPSRSLDYKHTTSKQEALDIAEFYWRIDPDKDYEKLPHNYVDESGYHSTNLYNQPFDIGNESCSLRRSRSLAVIREETFSDLQISSTNSHRRSQLIPRAKLVNRGFFKERFTGSKQPTYYHHHHHLHQHQHHQQSTTLDRPIAEAPLPPDAAVAPPPDTTTITRESDEYYENLKRLDAHQQSIWQNEKSDLESLNSEYFRNSHHQSDSNGEKQRLYQSRHHKSTSTNRKYSAHLLGEESCPELSQSSVFPETTTTSNSDDQTDSLTNSEQEYDIERVEEILSKVYDEKFEIISLTEEQNQKRAENTDEQGALIAYDSVYLSSEESSEGTIVEEKQESASLLHISIEDIYDPPERPEVIQEEPVDHPRYSQILKVNPPSVIDSKPKILAVVEKKKLKRFSDYAIVPSQRRGVLEHLTYVSTQSTNHHQLIDNQYYSLPDVNIGKSLKVSERIDAKLRSSYNLKEENQNNQTVITRSSDPAAIYDSIKRFGRAHKKARQREEETKEPKDINHSETEPEVEKPKEAPSIQVETCRKEIITTESTATPIELGQFRIIVTDAQNNVIEEDSIDGHTSSLNPEPESANENHSNQQLDANNDTNKLAASSPKRTLTRTPSKPKRLTGTITHTEVYKAKDRRVHNTYRARPIKVKPNDSLRRVGNMSRPQVIQVVDSKRGSMERKHPLADKAAEDEFLQKVDAIRCYWSKLSQDDSQNGQETQIKHEDAPPKTAAPKKDFILGEPTKSLIANKPLLTDDDFQSLMPSIEIVELDGDKQATIVKANPDEPVPEFDHIRYKVMKPNIFRSNILNRNKKEAQFDGLIQYLQEYSFQELLTNNNVVIVEPVRTKIEKPLKTTSSDGQHTKPGGGQNCKITGGAGNTSTTTTADGPANTTNTTNNKDTESHNKLSKRHFFYQPVRVNRELLEEELPTPDTVRNVRKFFEENVLPNRHGAGEGLRKTTPSPDQQLRQTEGRRAQRSRFRYLTIDTSYGNGQGVVGNGTGSAPTLRKWDSVSLSSGISSGDLSSPCECSNGDAGVTTVDGRSPQQKDDTDNGHAGKQQHQDVEIRGGMHVRDFIRRHNACGSQDSNGLCPDYLDGEGEDEDPEEDADDDDLDDELCESYYVSEDVLEKIRECGSTVTYYGGRVMMHSPPATGATLRIPRSKIEFLTCNSCQPNQCPHKDQLHDQLAKRNYTGIKFKLVKSNSCSSRLELIGTQRHNNHETHHPTTIGEDESIDDTETNNATHNYNHNEDDDDYDDGEPLVRRLVHRLETTGRINSYTGPRIIESQCIEKTRRPTSLVVERQKFEQPSNTHKRLSEGFTINSQMVGSKGAPNPNPIPDPLAYVQLLKQVTVNNHINVPLETESDSPCFTSSAMDIRLSEKAPGAALAAATINQTNGKVRRNKNVDLAFTMKGPNGTMKKSNDASSAKGPENPEKNARITSATKDSTKNVTIVEHFDGHLPKDEANNNKAPSTDLIVDSALVRHYVTNDKRLFTKRKYDDIEFEEFEVYDPLKDAQAKAEQLVDDLAEEIARATSISSSSDELKSNPDECYDSLDDKL